MSNMPASAAYPELDADSQNSIQIKCDVLGIDAGKRPFRVMLQRGKKKVILSSAGYDMVAFSTGQYLGADVTDFGPNKLFSKKIGGILVEEQIPEYASNTVYRWTQYGTATFTGKVYAREYLNDLSHVRNIHMFLDKWAHCVAMRKAFPDHIGSEAAAEEIDSNMDFSKGELGTVTLKDMPESITATEGITSVTNAVNGFTIIQPKDEINQLISEVFS